MFRVNILLPDPAVQTKGAVVVYHNVSRSGEEFKLPNIDFVRTVTSVTASFPLRYTAVHYCLESGEGNLGLYNKFISLSLNTLPSYSKVRSRIHVGSTIEIQYALRSHGIPLNTFPLDISGNIRDDIFYEWFHKYQRKQIESEPLSNPIALDPTVTEGVESLFTLPECTHLSEEFHELLNQPGQMIGTDLNTPLSAKPPVRPAENDVLFGRGRIIQSWPGNIKFREFLEKHSEDYDNLPRKDRRKRTIELTQELYSKRVRFFEQTLSGEWTQIDITEARKRVSQAFRSMRKKK